MVAALRTAAPGIGANALALLQEAQPAPIRLLLTTLINELDACSADVFLVLDDYHVIDSREVHEGMAFLLEHLPPQAAPGDRRRADPALPLAQPPRSRGELRRGRAADLRFTADEAAAYLNDAMGLELTAEDVAALEGADRGLDRGAAARRALHGGAGRRIGFIAGLRRRRPLRRRLPRGGGARRQPEHVRDFLLQTSILDRMNGPLCDALTGRTGAGRCWRTSTSATCSWSRWTTAGSGTATTTSSPTCSRRDCWTSSPTGWRTCTGWRATGTRRTATGRGDPARDGRRRLLRRGRPGRAGAAGPAPGSTRGDAAGWLEMLPSEVLRGQAGAQQRAGGARMSTGTFDGVESRLRDGG